MGKTRGFRLGRKLVKVIGCLLRRIRRTGAGSRRLGQSAVTTGFIWKLCNWGRKLRGKSYYNRIGQESGQEADPIKCIPKGYSAVYVGGDDDDACRVLVPVIYFNHPLFADLLREAEEIYGFDYGGGIQIPCRRSEFEDVRKRIAAAKGGCCRRGKWSGRPFLMAC